MKRNVELLEKGNNQLKIKQANDPGNKINCTHHWIIEPSKNHISMGRCIFCNKSKEFIDDWEVAVKLTQSPRVTKLALSLVRQKEAVSYRLAYMQRSHASRLCSVHPV